MKPINMSLRTQTCILKTYLLMFVVHFLRSSHLPHQVANDNIKCYDTNVCKYLKI